MLSFLKKLHKKNISLHVIKDFKYAVCKKSVIQYAICYDFRFLVTRSKNFYNAQFEKS